MLSILIRRFVNAGLSHVSRFFCVGNLSPTPIPPVRGPSEAVMVCTGIAIAGAAQLTLEAKQ